MYVPGDEESQRYESQFAKLDEMIVDRIAKHPGATLADINTGLITDEAGRLDPGRADRLIHQRLQRLKMLAKIYKNRGFWYIR